MELLPLKNPLTAAALFVLSAGAGAIALIEFTEFPIAADQRRAWSIIPVERLRRGARQHGIFHPQPDGSELTINGLSKYDPAPALQDGQRVQEGFVLLDGTRSSAPTTG